MGYSWWTMLVSGKRWRASAIHTCIHSPTDSHSGCSRTQQSPLCYTVAPCWLPMSNGYVQQYVHGHSKLYPLLPFFPLATKSSFSITIRRSMWKGARSVIINIRDKQIKTATRNHLLPVRRAIIKQPTNRTSLVVAVQGDTGSIPGPWRFHMLQIPYATEPTKPTHHNWACFLELARHT